MTPSSDVTVRDASLRRLNRINRWLIAGALTLTGVLSGVAAQAFPGGSVTSTSSTKTGTTKASSSGQHQTQGSAATLQAAAQAPEAASGQESTSASESAATQESSSAVVSGGS